MSVREDPLPETSSNRGHGLGGAARAATRLAAFGGWAVFTGAVAGSLNVAYWRTPEAARWPNGLRVFQMFMRGGAKIFGLRITVEGPLPPPGSLIISNHHSYLDAVALAAVTPCYLLSKAEVSRWPVIGRAAIRAGVPFVERGRARSRAAAVEVILSRLRRGISVVNFSEGTTTGSPTPAPFRAGLFARIAGQQITVAPVRLDYADSDAHWLDDDTFLGHLVKIAAKPHLDLRVRFADSFSADTYTEGYSLRDECYARVCNPVRTPARAAAQSVSVA